MKTIITSAAAVVAVVASHAIAVAGPGAGATLTRFGQAAARAAERRADAPAYALTGQDQTELVVRPEIRGGRRVSGHYVRIAVD